MNEIVVTKIVMIFYIAMKGTQIGAGVAYFDNMEACQKMGRQMEVGVNSGVAVRYFCGSAR